MRDHWELLSRARAVDNQVYVATPSPARDTEAGYVAWGHSSVVNAWGEVVARADEGEEIVYAEDDDQTPLVPADTPRKAQPGAEQNNEACPWEPSGCRPIEAGLARPLSLSYLPSDGDNALAVVPTKSPNSAQLR